MGPWGVVGGRLTVGVGTLTVAAAIPGAGAGETAAPLAVAVASPEPTTARPAASVMALRSRRCTAFPPSEAFVRFDPDAATAGPSSPIRTHRGRTRDCV